MGCSGDLGVHLCMGGVNTFSKRYLSSSSFSMNSPMSLYTAFMVLVEGNFLHMVTLMLRDEALLDLSCTPKAANFTQFRSVSSPGMSSLTLTNLDYRFFGWS